VTDVGGILANQIIVIGPAAIGVIRTSGWFTVPRLQKICPHCQMRGGWRQGVSDFAGRAGARSQRFEGYGICVRGNCGVTEVRTCALSRECASLPDQG